MLIYNPKDRIQRTNMINGDGYKVSVKRSTAVRMERESIRIGANPASPFSPAKQGMALIRCYLAIRSPVEARHLLDSTGQAIPAR